MKLKEVNECMAHARREIGEALLASVIANIENGSSIAKYNCDDKTGAIAAQVTSFLKDVVANDGQQVGRYMFCEVNEHITGLFIIMDEYVWQIAFDPTKMPLGMLVNVYLDDFIAEFEAAAA